MESKRCLICRKKLKDYLIAMHTCRCNGFFCSSHMHQHDCSYIHKTTNNDQLRIIARKIDKI